MNQYELAVLLHPDLEIDIDKPLKKIDKILADAKAKLIVTDNWGKRKLAYPINGLNFAVYVFWRFKLAPAQVAELERGLKLADEVIRHLIVKLDKLDVAAGANQDKTESANPDDNQPSVRTKD